jgi:pyruvate,water dikinase
MIGRTEMTSRYIRWFKDLRVNDVALVGGKNSSLGELFSSFPEGTVKVPNGFALTADSYRDALTKAGMWDALHAVLDDLDKSNIAQLAERAAKARDIVYAATGAEWLSKDIVATYRELEAQYGKNVAVAVRSSATAEDLPNASFAGQHDSYLHVCGEVDVVEACRRCFASLFTDRAISYRIDNGFDHFKVFLSVGVMKMVRSDLASSGVIFTIDTESGFPDVVVITGSYGLGENVVQGKVDPDEFYVHKPTLARGHRVVLNRKIGGKQLRMVYGSEHGAETTHSVATDPAERERFCITDAEVLALADSAVAIEKHYSAAAGRPMPMDIEWAKDGSDGQLYIVQARPETVASRRDANVIERHVLDGTGSVLTTGRAIGEKIATGRVRVIHAANHDLYAFQPGEVLVADTTTPDWEPVMKIASAIITNRGGRTCHAAIVARELGIPAIVGCGDATDKLQPGFDVTVSCAEGEVGKVYLGKLPFKVEEIRLGAITMPRTHVMVNLGDPELAFRTAMMPHEGVGLARMEFVIQEHIGIHPMALVHPERVRPPKVRKQIEQLTRLYQKPEDFFVERLSEGLGTIAAAFYPKPVIVRLSDFKTNEYAGLLGGSVFEPKEDNPMIGFRGASRYAHPAYLEGFALECRALKRVRDDMGLSNMHIMVPFCRRIDEANRVLDVMAKNGLARGQDGLKIYVMCEIPNNVIQIDAFSQLFDGFSIGSNDLTQLTLGVDRDSETVAFDFDERDPGMLEMLKLAVTGAKRNGRHVGICGEAPATYPEIAKYLVGLGIDSISVNPGSVLKTITVVQEAEQGSRGSQKAAE